MEEMKDLVSRKQAQMSLQTTYSSLNESIKYIEEKEKITILIERLGSVYGHLFMSASPTQEMLDLKIAEWQVSIGHYSYEQLHNGIKRCKEVFKDTVNLTQFIECLKFGDRAEKRDHEYDTQRLSKLETPAEKSERMTRGKIALDKLRVSLVTGVFKDVK